MDFNEAPFSPGLNRLKPDPLPQAQAGPRSYLQALQNMFDLLARTLPLRGIALLQPDREPLIAPQDGVDALSPALDALREGLDWAEGDLLSTQAEHRVSGANPGLAFCCIPLHTPVRHADAGCTGLVLFGKEGAWTQREQALLTPVCSLLALLIGWEQWGHACMLQNSVLNDIMDSMSAGIYVTDPETDRILFMNQSLKRMLGHPHPEGERCWEVMQAGMTRRCDFCPLPLLLNSEEAHPSFLWEGTNTRTGRIFENHDSLMTWVDGRTVHIHQSIDVTEVRRLYQAATIDDLTGLLNRQAGRENLQKLLDGAKQDHLLVTICLLDIDGFQKINEIYGHSVGDDVIIAMARAIRTAVGPDACRFRLGGDKFLAGLPGVDLSGAAHITRQIEAYLKENCPPELGEPPAFYVGMLELPPDHALTLTDVMGAVDEKLYEKKRLVHIQKLERGCFRAGQILSPEEFEFDHDLLFPALVQSTEDYLFVCNLKTNVSRYAPNMAAEFALPSEVLQDGMTYWESLIHGDDLPALLEAYQVVVDGRSESMCVEYRAKNRVGEWVWLRCRGHLERDTAGRRALFAGLITNLGKKNKIDHLTGLLNKLEFEAHAKRLLEQAGPLTMMIFGLDDLRHINNLYDRSFGDEVIRIASQKLQSLLPVNAYVFRLDGDEFGALIRGDSLEEAEAFFHRTQAAFGHQQTYDGKKFFCTMSSGCVFASQDRRDYQQLLKYAHFAMEHAKQHGKNQLCFFSQGLLTHRERLLTLTELLRESVESGFTGFSLHFQPVTDGLTTQLRGVEALCRWQCAEYGAIPPMEFIPLLEESGLILPVGRWIFQEAVQTCAQWQKRMPDFMMSINLSNLQLEDPTFIDFMEETLISSGVDPAHLVVELTESYLASHVEVLSSYLERLHRLHVLVSMDDFGTGYSSLGILKQYPIDIVKIDRTFVKDITSSAFDQAFIQFVADLCHKLGMSVCLEGVETQEVLEVVRPMKLNYYQGFYFGRPMTKEAFEARFLPE